MSNKVSVFQADIPDIFCTIKQPPKALFYRGESLESIIKKPRVAIVGARKATLYGISVAKQLSADLSKQGIVIISGLAFGIDAAAHRAALETGGTTVAVLPSSIEAIYPRSHHKLAEQIARHGTLLSEIEVQQSVRKHHFIDRNRLIAALSDIIIIIEAAEKSGALHTATFAKEQGKIVTAIPGNINNPMSAGSNSLIRAGATLITSADDVLQLLNITPQQTAFDITLTHDEQIIARCIQNGTQSTPDIIKKTKMSAQKCNQTLTMLEIKGVLRSSPSGTWHLV